VLDLLITGVDVVDGTGAPRFPGAVGVLRDRIAWLGLGEHPGAEPEAARRIQASPGCVVTPGFVDVHNHSDLGPLVDPSMPSTLRQGVTTVVVGNCGTSPWPVAGAAESATMVGGDPATMNLRFDSFASFLSRLEQSRPSVNVAALVGHGAVRAEVLGWERRPPTRAELDTMRGLVDDAMDQGAVGFSTGLIYAPGMYAGTDEVVSLAQGAARRGGIYASHIRGEGEHLFRAVDEAIEVGRRAGLPAHVSHLKCETSLMWGRTQELLARLGDGDDVTADQYPYAAWGSVLWSLLPDWAPVHELPSLLEDPDVRTRLIRSVEEGEGDAFQSVIKGVGWDRIVIESTADTRCNGMSVAAIAVARWVEPADASFQLLIEEPETACIGHAMVEEDVRAILADPEVMVASDAASMSPEGPFRGIPVHPRNYGTFPRVLGPYVRDGVLTLESAVRKMTSLPANRFGLEGRGRIAEGAAADLVVFDPAVVTDNADFDTPHAYPSGIEVVVVNGVVAWDGSEGERSGRVLRHA
jgi:N-acyl-D-amino-acid deacylase